MSLIAGTSAIALGGIAAAVVAGWAQVKNAFTYLSSFIIVTADIDEALEMQVVRYLRENWKLLPSGLLVYKARYIKFHGSTSNMSTLVPFRVPAHRATYMRGGRLLFVSSKGSGMTLTVLRGTINTDEIIREALIYQSQLLDSDTNVGNRYQVIRMVGREKGAWASDSVRGGDGGLKSSGSSGMTEALAPSSGSVHLDTTRDRSFMYDSSNWIAPKSSDPFDNLYYPEEIERYIKQARQWLHLRKWYNDRQVPWRRGWLLYGPPGTGKTSLSKATAQALRIPIYQFFLATLSDLEMIDKWEQMDKPCMALLEDFDTVFNGRVSTTEHKSLTFDCILNLISGVGTVDGVFVNVTTNDLSKIDAALGILRDGEESGISTRPGRIDTVIRVGLISANNRLRLAQRILVDWPECFEAIVAEGEGMTPVQFQELCVQYAYTRLNDSFDGLNEDAEWDTYCKYSSQTLSQTAAPILEK